MVRESILTYLKETAGLTGLSFFVSGGGISYYFETILEGTDPRNIILPNIVFVIGMVLYFLFLVVDFMAGINVARHEHYQKYKDTKPWSFFRVSLLYKTLIKFLGVAMFGMMLCLATIFVEVLEFDWLFKTFLTTQGAVMLIACGFEIYSIGVNHEKRWGYKPRFFKFFDSILSIFEKGIVNRLERLLGGSKTEDAETPPIVEPNEDEQNGENVE